MTDIPTTLRMEGGGPERCFCSSGKDWIHETVWSEDKKRRLVVWRGCGVGDCPYAAKQYRLLIHLLELEEFPYPL